VQNYAGRVGFSCGSGRCGTKFLVELLALEPDVAASHERNPVNEAFHRYSQWYGLPVDHEGFLQAKQREIDEDLMYWRLSFEASAHLSLSIVELHQRFGARFILQIRRPDLVVNSFLRKGWYDIPIVRHDADKALGYQENDRFHHFLTRIVPSGDEFERWQSLTRIGRLAWYWNTINTRAVEQLSRLPDSHHRVIPLEEFDYRTYTETASFLGFEPTLSAVQFEAIARRRPNALDNVPHWSQWTDRETDEFEREVAPMAEHFGYVCKVSQLPPKEPARTPIPPRASPELERASKGAAARIRRTALDLLWTSGEILGAVPRRPVDLLYISSGNIPSRWANSVQTMKMSEAYGGMIPGFALLISTGLAEWMAKKVDLWRWYGIRKSFAVLRLPTSFGLNPDRHRGEDRRFIRFSPTYARKLRTDLVITRSLPIAYGCLIAGIPVVFEMHSVPRSPAHRRQLEAIAQHPLLVGVVALNDVIRGAVLRAGGNGDAMIMAGAAVDPLPFESACDRGTARDRFDIADERPVVVYTGHLYDYKGIAPLLEAARSQPDVLYLLVGGWPEDVERWRADASDLANVRFEGFVPNTQIPDYLAAADICIHPHSAHHDVAGWTSPLKLLEYMAAGRPIVATAIPGIRDLLFHDHNAIVVPPDDAASLAGGVRRLLDDPELAERLSLQACEDVEHHTWEKRARGVLERFAPHLL
jgi:glycosyltransferase involved in cell wall biosynthesis